MNQRGPVSLLLDSEFSKRSLGPVIQPCNSVRPRARQQEKMGFKGGEIAW